jgi:hypothetical protein
MVTCLIASLQSFYLSSSDFQVLLRDFRWYALCCSLRIHDHVNNFLAGTYRMIKIVLETLEVFGHNKCEFYRKVWWHRGWEITQDVC